MIYKTGKMNIKANIKSGRGVITLRMIEKIFMEEGGGLAKGNNFFEFYFYQKKRSKYFFCDIHS